MGYMAEWNIQNIVSDPPKFLGLTPRGQSHSLPAGSEFFSCSYQ